MATTILNLVVIRSANFDRAEEFYRILGLSFDRHAHGKGPEHLANESNSMVFEIYPLTDEEKSTLHTRLGFLVEDVDLVISQLRAKNVEIRQIPTNSPWGRRAVVKDFDGHIVEIVSHSVEAQ